MLILDLNEEETRITANIFSKDFYKTIDRIKRIPGSKYDPENKVWTFPRNVRILQKLKQNFKLGYKKNEYELLGKKEPYIPTGADIFSNSINENLNSYMKKLNFDTLKLPPRPFQKLAIASANLFLNNIGGFLIADTMGLGKTCQTLAIINNFKQKGKINKTLVSSPKNVKYQWGHETEKFTHLNPIVVDGYNKKKRLECYNKEGDIYITNHDQLILKDDFKAIKNKISPDMIVVDEAHFFKNRSTKRAKQLKKMAKHSKYRLALTGTPMQNHPSDLYSIYEYLLNNKFMSWKEFKKKYILFSYTFKYPMEVGYQNLFDLKKRASKFMIRRLTEDVGNEIPTVKMTNKMIPLDLVQKQINQQLEKKVEDMQEQEKTLRNKKNKESEIEDLEGKILGYKNIQAEVADDLRLLEESDSFICEELIKDKHIRISNKTREFLTLSKKILKENKKYKIVVFSRFATMVKLLKKEVLDKGYSKKVSVLYGDLNEKERDEQIQIYRNDPECRMIIMSDAGCTGVNLENSSHLINYDLPWNPAILDQRNGRIRRIGSPWDEVYVTNLISLGSIDEQVFEAIENKRETSDKIIENSKEQTERLKKLSAKIS